MKLKKALALLLAMAVLLGCLGVGLSASAAGTRKEVKSISAKWIGSGIPLELGVDIGPADVEVTLKYTDGTSKVVTQWWNYDDDSGDWWEIEYDYDYDWGSALPKELELTIAYSDDKLWSDYLETVGDYDFDWYGYLEAMPHTTLKAPVISTETYLKSFDAKAIKAGDSVKLSLAAGESQLFTFTPGMCRQFYINSDSNSESDPLAYLFDSNFECIDYCDDFYTLGGNSNLNFGFLQNFNKGETYYLLVTTYSKEGGDFTLRADRRVTLKNSNLLQYLYYYRAGGWLFSRTLGYNPYEMIVEEIQYFIWDLEWQVYSLFSNLFGGRLGALFGFDDYYYDDYYYDGYYDDLM